ncbi:DAK2 domain-containing protein [Ruminococcaceae bacterium OttesenSCG-928-L11]|nr:DAK2 domain-containing protein [Ruminococcaceae bacterium OttesenSCG-928-L11]
MITGNLLRDAFISAANNIAHNRKAVDALNVFPVPDGDTGTNMSMTIGAAKRELALVQDPQSAGEVAQIAASALLRGARGNSGVILSLLFRGLARGLQGKKEATAADVVAALEYGVDSAYKAVMKPTEGTILTVARESSVEARRLFEENPDIAVTDLWDAMVTAACKSLDNTPELLPVLKKAGVVDAGGKGLIVIYQGMAHTFHGLGILPEDTQGSMPQEIPDERNAAGEYEGEITFTYCTEFLVVKDPERANMLSLRAYLESIGDSVVVVDDDDIIKCHVHTDNPGDALQKGLESGMLSNLKIENMRLQHANQRKSAQAAGSGKKFTYAAVDDEQKYGFVSVAAGSGVHALFTDLGVSNVVSGGQTMNPSTDDILEAVHATPAQNVIVLPNNKNIIMAAEQCVKLADRNVYVLPTKSIPQGLAALLAFDGDLELQENQLNMVKAIEKVGSGQITFAARDSNYENHKIKKGEILALENNKLAFVEKDVTKAVVKLTRSLVKKDSAFITILYGEDVTEEEAAAMEEQLRAKLPDDVELAMINGGQPVYYYIISVE